MPVSLARYRRLIASFFGPLQETHCLFLGPLQETYCLFLWPATGDYCLFFWPLEPDNFRRVKSFVFGDRVPLT